MTLFPELLDKAIKNAGFKSLSAFAREAGTSTTTVSKVIKNGRTPPSDQLPQWGRAAKLTGDRLVEFIRAGEAMKAQGQSRAAPHIQQLVEENSERGRQITALKQRIADIEASLLTSKPATDEAIRKRYESSTREQLLDAIVRLNREVMFFSKGQAGPASP